MSSDCGVELFLSLFQVGSFTQVEDIAKKLVQERDRP